MSSSGGVVLTVEQQLAQMHRQVLDLRREQAELRHTVARATDSAAIRATLLGVMQDEYAELDQLRRDAVALLNLLVERGLVLRADLNAAIEREIPPITISEV